MSAVLSAMHSIGQRLYRQILLLSAALSTALAHGQVATAYTFSSSSGTFTPITGGTVLENTTVLFGFDVNPWDDDISAAQTIPAFNFNGTVYTQMYVSANGFITFGSAPTGTNYTPLSSAATYAGAISALGCDLNNTTNAITSTRDIRWQTVGNEVIIQWRGARRLNVASEGFSFQIRLNTVTNAISFVYGAFTAGPGSNTAIIPQMGLRGPNNTFATEVNNRQVGSGAETWAATLAGTANNNTMRLTSTAPAKSWTSGQTYTFTPCAAPTVSVSPTSASFCAGGSVGLTASGATGSYNWSPASGLSSTTSATPTANPTTSTMYTVTATNTGCPFPGSATVAVGVKANPTGVSASSSAPSACTGSAINLTGAGTLPSSILSNNFNSGIGSWTTTNTSTGGTPANAAWTPRANGYVYSSVTFNSNDASQFVMSNSDAQGSGSTTATTLQSPAFNTEGYSAVSLNFFHYYRFNSGTDDRGRVEVSTDNVNWTVVQTYSATTGGPAAFASATVNLNAYANLPLVYLRFRYSASWDWYWAVDNVSITGTPSAFSWSWTSTPAGFTSSAQSPSSVAHTETRTYNLTATAGNGCTGTANTGSITAIPLPDATLAGNGPFCASGSPQLTGNLTGTGPWSITYTTNGGSPTVVSGIASSPYTINPTGPITSTTTYAITAISDANCAATSFPASVQVVINTPATANAGGPYSTCTTTAVNITATANGSGTWSGGLGSFASATSTSTTYTPDISEVGGSVTLTWTTDDPDGAGPCSSVASNSTLTVNPLPTVTCPANITGICSNDAAFTLTGGSPAGGTYSGTGVSGGSFDPAVAGGGVHTITYSYTDGNTCTNSCQFTIAVTTATTWYADTDGDTYGDPADDSLSCGTPVGYVLDNTDDCPTVFGRNGDSCNDGNPFTTGDILVACACVGTPVPCDNWTLTINTDGSGGQTTWQIVDATSPFVLASGGPYPSNSTITPTICVPQGACFDLIFNDAGGNGINPGGWVLRDNNSRRVIDNFDNGSAFTSTCQPDVEFCNPVSTQALTVASCDRLDWLPNEYIVAAADDDVSAEWGIGNQADDGYQFWFFNPVGGYTRRILHSHAVSMGFGPAGPTRACHLPLNFTTLPLPFNTLLNVRVRALVNGIYGDFGPACRFMLLSAPPACPTTQLHNNPLNIGTTYSCGVTGKVVGASGYAGKLWANLTSGATHYRWRFAVVSEGYTRVITTTTYFVTLGAWSTNPLLCGTFTYDVDVAVSMDGGATYCPYGPVCTVGITNSAPNPCTAPFQGGGGNLNAGVEDGAVFNMWPNPNRGDQLNLSLSEVEEGVTQVFVEVYDLFGKRVHEQAIATDAGFTAVMEINSTLASGMYTVNVVAGTKTYTERLVIQ